MYSFVVLKCYVRFRKACGFSAPGIRERKEENVMIVEITGKEQIVTLVRLSLSSSFCPWNFLLVKDTIIKSLNNFIIRDFRHDSFARLVLAVMFPLSTAFCSWTILPVNISSSTIVAWESFYNEISPIDVFRTSKFFSHQDFYHQIFGLENFSDKIFYITDHGHQNFRTWGKFKKWSY